MQCLRRVVAASTHSLTNFGGLSPLSLQAARFVSGSKSPEVLWTETVPTNFSSLRDAPRTSQNLITNYELRITNYFNSHYQLHKSLYI
jgi:hypothetical protein